MKPFHHADKVCTLVTFHSLMKNLHFTYLIFILNHLRARFESLCGNLIQKCVALIDDVCAKANVSSSDIEKVIQTKFIGSCLNLRLIHLVRFVCGKTYNS